MEPEQNYLTVGIFVVVIVTGILGFLVWIVGMDQRNFDTYQTFVSESVNGLANGSTVKYRGVEVGKVSLIEISRSNPAKIRILMDIAEETPITVGTVAMLQLQGITGISYIELRGTVAGGEQIQKKGKNKYPIIPSARSEFRQIVDTVPAMLEKFTQLADRMSGFASDENQIRFKNIMTNLETFSNGVSAENEQGESLIKQLQEATKSLGSAAASINEIASNSRQDTKRILKSTQVTLDKISKLSDSTGEVTQKTYSDLHQLLTEIKKTTRDLQSLTRSVKDNPSSVIIPPQSGGVKVQ